MAWWNKKVVFPVKRPLVAVAAKIKARKPDWAGRGILNLHEDVEMCGYEDVQVMWEMVRRSELEVSSSDNKQQQQQQRKRRFWRPPSWARRTAAAVN